MKEMFIRIASAIIIMFCSAGLYARFSPMLGWPDRVFIEIYALIAILGVVLTNHFLAKKELSRGGHAKRSEYAQSRFQSSAKNGANAEAGQDFEDFNDPPLWGQDPDVLGRQFGVKIDVLNSRPDDFTGSYTVRVSGSRAGLMAFRKEYLRHQTRTS